MKPRKSWEPKYRFGGNPTDCILPKPLGENQATWRIVKPSKPKRKRT